MQHELLDDPEGHTAGGANQGTASYESSATVLGRIVSIRNRAGCQVADDIRIIDLTVPVVSSGDKWSCHGMQKARLRCAGTLIEVAGILVKERGQ